MRSGTVVDDLVRETRSALDVLFVIVGCCKTDWLEFGGVSGSMLVGKADPLEPLVLDILD